MLHRFSLPLLMLAFAFCAPALTAQDVADALEGSVPSPGTSTDDVASAIEALVERYHEVSLFNGSVLVSQGGEVIYEGGFGEANMQWDVPNMADTKFRIGSVTKQFTAALILQLMEEGRLALDDAITEHLPAYPAEPGDRVTIHHLLRHTSGIPSYTGLPNFLSFTRDPYAPDSLLILFQDLPLEFEPGAEFRYNNSGYFLLGVIIERVTGKPYDEVLRTRILEPLGMASSGYHHYGEIIERMASGYQRAPGGFEHAAYLDTSVPYAAGMMYSTGRDLYLWDQALLEGRVFQRPETHELMFTPGEHGYGYGWFIREVPVGDRQATLVQHGGGIFGFTTAFWRFPEDHHAIAVFDNTGGNHPDDIANDIAKILFGLPHEMPKTPIGQVLAQTIETDGVEAALTQYATLKDTEPDAYNFAEDQLNTLGYAYLQRGDVQAALAVFRLNVEAYPDAYNPYDSLGEALLAAGDTTQAIQNYERSLELNLGNDNARRVLESLGVEVDAGDPTLTEAELEDYVGRYQLAPTFAIEVTRDGGQLYAQATAQPAFEIFPAERDIFYLKVVEAQLHFSRDADGAVDGLTLHQNGQAVPGAKVE